MSLQKKSAFFSLVVFCVVVSFLGTPVIGGDIGQDIDIPYEKFVLDNGLTLIVHEDHKAPIVAVNVWYHVGSKNEKPGRTGFAHLFEHLMFNGSEHFNDDYMQVLERVGATDLNGTTSEDRTNYFQNVPTSALDVALWMESDRMGYMKAAIDQGKLDEQRGVVQNEKRQYENEPYGVAYELITEATFPKGHPYSWTVIGSMEDLDAATLDDVHEWFKTYYGPANAVLSVVGDIDAQTASEKVEEYFGNIPSGPPVARHDVWIAKRSGIHRQKVEDRVPQARIYKVWNIPQWADQEGTYLDLVSDILGAGKNSRLYKRLVYDDQIATDVSVYVELREIAGLFNIEVDAKPGGDLAEVERVIDEELARFLTEGPTEKEVERVKIQYIAGFIRGIERIGGFGGKSDVLAQSEVFGGHPEFYKTNLERVREATVRDLHETAVRWLSDGVYILEVHPFPEYTSTGRDVDRSQLPAPGEQSDPEFPDLQRTTLSNGLKVILAERHAVPVINFSLLVDAGYASDQFGLPGTARLAMDMLDEGTKSRTSLEISEELALLGTNLNTGSNLDMSVVSLSALKANVDPSLDIFADVILNPSFPKEDFERLKKLQLDVIEQEKKIPIQMALRVFPGFLYGKGHAYGNPFYGSGTEASVSEIERSDLQKFHTTWFKPNNATLVVVGATTLNEMKPKLEKLFREWEQGNVPTKNIVEVEHQSKSVVYIMDKPGALQSLIIAGHVAPPKANPDEIAIETMNNILGGTFTARMNMNLREDKHWSYGARSLLLGTRGQRPFLVYASVQTDKTSESLAEILKEMRGIQGTQPATDDELQKVQKNRILRMPGSWETINELGASINQIVRFGLPDDYFETYPDEIRSMRVADVTRAAQNVLHPDNVVWVVVGDREHIEGKIREMGFDEIGFIDGDGNPVE
ncbi:MAG: insulinase family protein [Gemmatimonadota bacterium]|nr:MAG: insulinase family protein [Gemmatimonadota bacterium]